MKYSTKYFKNSMPEWKRKKDPFFLRLFYRPISFWVANLCVKAGVNANEISIYSAIIAIIACILYIPDNLNVNIIGGVLISVWLLLDCVDGNLARSFKKQPFGEFVDAMSSYILVAFLGTCLGIHVYYSGGILFDEKCPWGIVLGAVASSSDTLMRLIYQKYKNTYRDLEEQGVIGKEKDVRTDKREVGSIRVRIEMELGIAGILPIAILICTIFEVLDLVLVYMFIYYGGACVVATVMYVNKVMKYKDIEME